MNTTNMPTNLYLLEDAAPFSKSLLWTLQREYFEEKGVNAWRQGEVPHYVTSNLTVANTYAELVFAFLRDRQRMGSCSDPLYICELGAGSGRLAYHFLHQLQHMCSQTGVAINSFKYVMTDVIKSNLDFWRSHLKFQGWIKNGVLDMAILDVTKTDRLELQISGETIVPGSLKHPLTVIANYLFDSIPQELYYFENKKCHPCTVSLYIDKDPANLDAGQMLEKLQCEFGTGDEDTTQCTEFEFKSLVDFYREKLNEAYLLFPLDGLRCLKRLGSLSQNGMLLLSADKGDYRLWELASENPPSVVRHGSFSVSVNYNAFKMYCEQNGGLALFPDKYHSSLNFGCMFFMEGAKSHRETIHAYVKYIKEFSPDDFYSITKHARQHISSMTVEDILAYLRLSHYDSHQFGRYLPRLMALAEEITPWEQCDLIQVVDRIWDRYFPIGEQLDLAFMIGSLFYSMNEFQKAIEYYERSNSIYGVHDGTKYNIALCQHMLGLYEEAEEILLQLEESGYESREMKEILAAYRVNREVFGDLYAPKQNYRN